MKLMDFVGLLKRELGIPVFPIQFPDDNRIKNCITVDVVLGSMGVVNKTTIQLMARSGKPQDANEILSTVIDTLHNRTNLEWNDNQIIKITSRNTSPYYMGHDDFENHLYNMQLIILHSKI